MTENQKRRFEDRLPGQPLEWEGADESINLTEEDVKLLEAADEYTASYEGDDRACIQADVINAFCAGYAFAGKALTESDRAIESEVLAQAGVRAEPVALVQTEQAQAEPVAWMNPETLDVIHDARKRAWENDFGMGGKAKAAGYTHRLVTPAQVPAAEVRAQALEEAAKLCDEMEQHYSDYKDTALLNGEVDLSNAASGEPRACRFLAERIRNLAQSSTADFDYSDGGCPGYCTEGGNTSALGEGADQ